MAGVIIARAPGVALAIARDGDAARVEALGLGRALSPDAALAETASAVMDMLCDKACAGRADRLPLACRASASWPTPRT